MLHLPLNVVRVIVRQVKLEDTTAVLLPLFIWCCLVLIFKFIIVSVYASIFLKCLVVCLHVRCGLLIVWTNMLNTTTRKRLKCDCLVWDFQENSYIFHTFSFCFCIISFCSVDLLLHLWNGDGIWLHHRDSGRLNS